MEFVLKKITPTRSNLCAKGTMLIELTLVKADVSVEDYDKILDRFRNIFEYNTVEVDI